MADSVAATRSADVDSNMMEAQTTEANQELEAGANGASTTSNATTSNATSAVNDPAVMAKSESGEADNQEKQHEETGRSDSVRGRGGNRGGSGRGGHAKANRENIRSRFDNLGVSTDQDEIRNQVEFYFSDSNLPIDPYLFKLVGGHANNFIPLKIITDFKRMRHFQPYSTVLEAVKQSDFLEVNDKEEVRRKDPLDKKFTDDTEENKKIQHGASMDLSIYAKGFGDEGESTQLDIEQFFAPFNAKVVRLRRAANGLFKGSVFVEFHNEDAQKEFLEHDPKPTWKEKELEIMSKKAYVEMKHDGIIDGLVKPRTPARNGGHRGRGGRGRGRAKFNHERRRDNKERNNDDAGDPDDWNKRRERDNGSDRRGRGNKRGRDNRGRGGRDNRRGRSGTPEDYNAQKQEKMEGMARRLSDANTKAGNKRGRDEDGEAREDDAKKVKPEAAIAQNGTDEGAVKRADQSTEDNSTKRAREAGDQGREGDQKKTKPEAATAADT
nr:la protein like [Quercus suber]